MVSSIGRATNIDILCYGSLTSSHLKMFTSEKVTNHGTECCLLAGWLLPSTAPRFDLCAERARPLATSNGSKVANQGITLDRFTDRVEDQLIMTNSAALLHNVIRRYYQPVMELPF